MLNLCFTSNEWLKSDVCFCSFSRWFRFFYSVRAKHFCCNLIYTLKPPFALCVVAHSSLWVSVFQAPLRAWRLKPTWVFISYFLSPVLAGTSLGYLRCRSCVCVWSANDSRPLRVRHSSRTWRAINEVWDEGFPSHPSTFYVSPGTSKKKLRLLNTITTCLLCWVPCFPLQLSFGFRVWKNESPNRHHNVREEGLKEKCQMGGILENK